MTVTRVEAGLQIHQARQRAVRHPWPDSWNAARQMEEPGNKIIKLNIGNRAPFGFDRAEEISRT